VLFAFSCKFIDNVLVKYLAILGRQADISIAELESVFGSEAVRPVSRYAAEFSVERQAQSAKVGKNDFKWKNLGGTIKVGGVLAEIPATDIRSIEDYLSRTIPDHLKSLPDGGKLKLGFSYYGVETRVDQINAIGIRLKKIVKAAGTSVRVVPNSHLDLNAAQVLNNKLTHELGWELLLVRDGNKTVLAQTVHVQDIDAYAARDQARPKRDAFVGMLPPKLAQIIINLACGQIQGQGSRVKGQGSESSPLTLSPLPSLLDPFCGTGVVLQEALLMGYNAYGTDLAEKMIDYSEANLRWLKSNHPEITGKVSLSVGDATKFSWDNKLFNVVAGETYLGQPFSALPNPQKLQDVIDNVDHIHSKFLKNLGVQIPSGTRLCLAVPAWCVRKDRFKHLPTLDRLEKLGYKRIDFKHAPGQRLIYHRDDQIVGRELVVLIKL
jgi:hypothetical protein